VSQPERGAALPGMSRRLTLLFAIAGGAAVGNLYWTQPLLHEMGASFDVSAGAAGLLVTLTQVGYALGVLLVVPLGDTLDRQRLVPGVMACSVPALLLCAVAPSFAVLLIALAAVGFTTVTGQLLTPLAGDLASEDQRGRVIGTVASGLLIGILASRTISGLVADAFGWRTIFFAAAVVMLVLAAVLWREIPAVPPRGRMRYGKLLASVFHVVREHPSVGVTLMISALVFCVFTLFWTALTFLLSAPPFGYSVARIGLMGLFGLAGALAAQGAGRLHDRGWSVPAMGTALIASLAILAVGLLGATSIAVLLGVIVVFNIAIQLVNVLNQTRVLSVAPDARSRLNTAFVTCNFVGGGIGSTLAGWLWQHGGWFAVTLAELILTGLAILLWLIHRNRALAAAG
jgi:predicted MFS family arabinose efflux permease